jgi:hypothetical protein
MQDQIRHNQFNSNLPKLMMKSRKASLLITFSSDSTAKSHYFSTFKPIKAEEPQIEHL